MDSNLLTRILAPALPLLVIALIAGAAGYALTSTATRPVPALEAPAQQDQGVSGVVQNVSGNQLTLALEDGSRTTLELQPGAPIEVLRAIPASEIRLGDWLNGGAIPHAQTVLALVGIVLVEDPEVGSR